MSILLTNPGLLKTHFDYENSPRSIYYKGGASGEGNLRNAGVKIKYTAEQYKEMIKCRDDILYFINNYYKINSKDVGESFCKTYKWQVDFLKILEKNRYIVGMLPRQVGKCVVGSTIIKVRNKKTGEIFETSIKDFHDMIKEGNENKWQE